MEADRRVDAFIRYWNAYRDSHERPGTDEIKSLLWEAYGFREDDNTVYQGACQDEVRKLWRYLHPKRVRRRMKGRTKRLIRGAAIVLILLFSIWGAYMINDGRALAPVLVILLYYARTLFEDGRE